MTSTSCAGMSPQPSDGPQTRVRVHIPRRVTRPGTISGHPFTGVVSEFLADIRTVNEELQTIGQGYRILRYCLHPRHFVFDDFGECFHFTSNHAQPACHSLYWLQRGYELTDPVRRARDDENIEESVELAYLRRGHAAGEDGCLRQAGLGRPALERGALGAVADDQRPGGHAPVVQDRGGLEQRADPLVLDQTGDLADYVLVFLD